MTSTIRLAKELAELKRVSNVFLNIETDEEDIRKWKGYIVPKVAPYEAGFCVQLDFPADFPFRPPEVTFKTPIYHPNVDEKGKICMEIISQEKWKPATKIDQIILELQHLIEHPDIDHALRMDLAEEYRNNRKAFDRAALNITNTHGVPISVINRRT